MLEPRYVDSREDFQSRRFPLEQAGFKALQLAVGDVHFPSAGGDTVVIENKRVEQLLADMQSGQLDKQARRLQEASPFATLLISGHWAQQNGYLVGSTYTWGQVWNYLQTLQSHYGLYVQLATSDSHAVQRIMELAAYYAKDIHQSTQRKGAGNVPATFAALLPGFDLKRGKALLERFGTVQALANATHQDLLTVPGIGPTLAKRVRHFFEERVSA